MLTFGIIFLVFATSILLVFFMFALHPAGYSNFINPLKNRKIDNFQRILNNVPVMAWSETKNGVVWYNKKSKQLANKLAILNTSVLHETKSDKYNRFKFKMNNISYFFAFKKTDESKTKKDKDCFIQTLSATFAHLQVGIAVFDDQNELSLFNPALSLHLGLRPEWLLKKPNLLTFLDRLRNTHILPEPKDYASWRKTFLKIERSAMKDDYSEDWNLPDGRALRVIGRPHPSGTVVFLFDDVTKSLEMEREYRSEISNLKSTVDATTTGLILFDRYGKVSITNQTFNDTFAAYGDCKTIQSFSKTMQRVFIPTPVWGDLREFVEKGSERSQWQADIQFQAKESIMIRIEPLTNGGTLCEFHFAPKINDALDVGLTCAAQ